MTHAAGTHHHGRHVAVFRPADAGAAQPSQTLRLHFVHVAEAVLVGAPIILRDYGAGPGGGHGGNAGLYVGTITSATVISDK